MKFADRVRETSTSVGTGNFVLAGVPENVGAQRFGDAFEVGDVIPYAIDQGVAWEVGIAMYVALNTIERVTVLDSSENGGRVTFPSGVKAVTSPLPADVFDRSRWEYQPTWCIDWDNGNDARDGIAPETSIKTYAEYFWRTGGNVRVQTLIRQLSSTPEVVRMRFITHGDQSSPFPLLEVRGGMSGPLSAPLTVSASQAWSHNAEVRGTITCGVVGLSGKLCVVASGSHTGKRFFLGNEISSGRYIIGVPRGSNGDKAATLGVGDTFTVHDLPIQLPEIHVELNEFASEFVVFSELTCGDPLDAGHHQWNVISGRPTFRDCVVTALDTRNTSFVGIVNCYSYALRHFEMGRISVSCGIMHGLNVYGGWLVADDTFSESNSVNVGGYAGQTGSECYCTVYGEIIGLAVLDAPFTVGPGSRVDGFGRVWVSNGPSPAIRVFSGGQIIYPNGFAPRASVVAGNEMMIGGTVRTSASMPFVNENNLAMVVERA